MHEITPQAGTNITINGHHCYYSKNLVVINIAFTPSGSIGSTGTLISNLPSPKKAVNVTAAKNLGAGNSQAILNTSGNIRNDYDGFDSGKKYHVNFCYVR